MADFEAIRIDDGSTVTLRLNGELDIVTVPDFARRMGEVLMTLNPGRTLVVDLSGLEFFGVAGARVLFSAAGTCARIGSPMFVVARPASAAGTVLAGLDLTGSLKIVDHPGLVPSGPVQA
jgi:anti-anti-sigma factor